MAVSYTITPEAYAEDGERGDTLHQCPLCGIEYDIDTPTMLPPIGAFRWGVRYMSWGYQVTDNCDCHDKHVAEFGL